MLQLCQPRPVLRLLRRGAAAAVIVFDVTNQESLGKAKAWVKELQRQGSPNMIMALAGNKADLGESRAVTTEEAQVPCFARFPFSLYVRGSASGADSCLA